MFPYCRVPTHITALYVFTVINFLALFHVAIVQAEVKVLVRGTEETVRIIPDLPAQFGELIDPEGFEGYLAIANPINGCSILKKAPDNNTWILLIRQSNGTMHDNCKFVDKVRNAQLANYQAAIIYNYKSDYLVHMGGDNVPDDLIPSVFIGLHDAIKLQTEYSDVKKYYIRIFEINGNFSIMNYLIAFACIIGLIFLITVTTLVVRFIKDLQQRRRRQLSPRHLKKLPVKKFEKGDQYETCAICLDDYQEGEKLRILPCAHAYHTKCIDPWLTKNKRTCPVCKRRVFAEGEVPDSDDESDEDERTPLLPQHGGRQTSIGGNTFGASANLEPSPYSRYFDDDVGSTDSEADNGLEASGGIYNVASIFPSSADGSINADDEEVIVTLPPCRPHRKTDNSPIQIGNEAAVARPSGQQDESKAAGTSNMDDVVLI